MVAFNILKLKRRVVYKYRELLSTKKFNEDSIFTLLSFMFELSSKWFEIYVAEYFKDILHFDTSKVTWWYKDKWIDIKAEKDGIFYAIQCKKYGASHVTQKDILDFVENIKDLKVKYKNKIRFYFITTSWVNRYAKKVAEQNWIIIRGYKDILHMNKKLPINDFIKKNKWNSQILEGIDVDDVLNVFYLRKTFKRKWLADALYFILSHTLFKFTNYNLDYQKVDKKIKSNKQEEYNLLEKDSPIAKKNTFVGDIK